VTKSHLSKSQRSVKAKNEARFSATAHVCAFAQVRLCARTADRRWAWIDQCPSGKSWPGGRAAGAAHNSRRRCGPDAKRPERMTVGLSR
jgi:hypothetical protein